MTDNRRFGRIRVYEDQSAFLRTVLKLERDRVILQRRMHKKDGGTHSFNRQIHFIDQMLAEIDRTRDEMGWESEWKSTTDDEEALLETGT